MKKVILTKISGLFLLGILSVSCSTEEAVTGSETSTKNLNTEAFKSAFHDYALSKKDAQEGKTALQATNRMSEESVRYLNSIGIKDTEIEETTKGNKDMVISMAFDAFAKTNITNRKN